MCDFSLSKFSWLILTLTQFRHRGFDRVFVAYGVSFFFREIDISLRRKEGAFRDGQDENELISDEEKKATIITYFLGVS